MKFLVPNYSCLQNPCLGGYRPQIPVLSVLNWICWTPPTRKKFLGTPLVWREIYLLPQPGNEPQFVGRQACGLVTVVTELYGLLSQVTSSQSSGVCRLVAQTVVYWQWPVSVQAVFPWLACLTNGPIIWIVRAAVWETVIVFRLVYSAPFSRHSKITKFNDIKTD